MRLVKNVIEMALWCTRENDYYDALLISEIHLPQSSSKHKSVTLLYAIKYSRTSDSGPSEIGTQYNIQRTQVKVPKICFPIVLIHFELPRRGQPLYKGQNG